MTVESVTYINDLEPDRPRGSDRISQGDDHIRNIKKSIKQTFPNVDGEVSATDEEMNYLVGLTGPIKDELNSGANDLAQLEADVAKNTADIATNASGIATNASGISANAAGIASNDVELADHESRISNNAQGIVVLDQIKADKTYVDQQNAAQDSVIAAKADKTYVDSQNSGQNTEISKKADKTYVDSQNSSQNSAIAAKADKTYVDQQNSAQDAVIAAKAEKSYVDSQNNSQNSAIAAKADKTYVDSQDGAIIARLAELEDFVSKGGGSMIKPVEQPASVGQFSIKQGSYSKPATDDIYYAAPVTGNNTITFSVPAGKVFVMDYLFALGYVDIGLNSIKVDGVTMMPSVSGVMQFDSPFDVDFDFAAWPTPFSGSSIRVEQSIQFTYYDRNVAGDSPEVCISGLFVEA